MAGIYLHIPFCKQACHYCNFHFSTSLRHKSEMVAAILQEMALRKPYLEDETIETIYFGGGTPSLLTKSDLAIIFAKISQLFRVHQDAEITLEANPDDLSMEKLKDLKDTPINRLSIGIQSFFEEDLVFMNRAHNAKEALDCLQNAKKMGFHNLTIDLIYGTPTTTDAHWQHNLDLIFQEKIPHISCYCLTVEPQTALAHFVKTGKAQPVNEEQAARQFEILMQQMDLHGYEHYEISNFALPGHYSKHNSNYWLGEKYLGLGPSAHSFNGASRQWNVTNNAKYIAALKQGKLDFEKEVLSKSAQYNEYIMTALRTIWGCDLQKIAEMDSSFADYFLQHVQPFIRAKTVRKEDQTFTLTRKGKLLADKIAMELFR